MVVTVCRRGHVIDRSDLGDAETIREIERALTVAPLADPQFNARPKKYPHFVWNANRTRLAIPRFFRHPALDDLPRRETFGTVETRPNMVFRGSLKSELRQPEAVAATLDSLRRTGGAILSLIPGGGKTICSLSIACTLGLKTLIIVHKEFLMNQWIERIAQFVPTARVGRLQQNRAEVEDRDVVVAMIHSVALRAYPPETFDGFGTTIVDESHHISAPVFSQAMRVANAPYVLGLTATPERKDGLQCVLHWCLGDIAFQTQRREQRHVRVRVARWTPPDGYAVPITRFGKLNLPGMITELTEYADRNEMLLDTIRELAAEGRKIIVLSDRRAHCEFLRDRIDATLGRQAQLVGRAGLYIGGMTEAELKASEACRVIVATYGLATEGLDIPALDTLVLATPKSDVVQASGRILRECAGKVNDPLIVDVVDAVGVCFAQFNKRKAFYLTAGFAVGDVTASEPALAFLEDA